MRGVQHEVLARLNDPAAHQAPAFRTQITQQLQTLKAAYRSTYLREHARARLGQTEDRRKAALLHDPRIATLRRLATIELLPVNQLRTFEDRLTSLRSCLSLTESDLEATPVCPHCGFKPATEPAGASAAAELAKLDADLDAILAAWAATLLDNLEDPTVGANLDLLKPAGRDQLRAFLATRALPEPLDQAFIQAAQETLSGLVRVVVRLDDLRGALLNGGSPATPEELKKRFEAHLTELARGKEPAKVRLIVE
jgi:hypothetical protein